MESNNIALEIMVGKKGIENFDLLYYHDFTFEIKEELEHQQMFILSC